MFHSDILFMFEVDEVNRQIVHDFQLALLTSIGLTQFMDKARSAKTEYTIKFLPVNEAIKMAENLAAQGFKNAIPCGSVEYTKKIIEIINPDAKLKPINIPVELRQERFLGRNIQFGLKYSDIVNCTDKFVKDTTNFKGFAGLNKDIDWYDHDKNAEYYSSDIIDINSEWRVFIHREKLIEAKHYLGDFRFLPDLSKVEEMIKAYVNAPKAYTIDVIVNGSGTYLLEVHDIFACGTYGFDYQKFLTMYTDWFYEL